MTGNNRVTYKDIMEFQEKIFNELTEIRGDIAVLDKCMAEDREKTKHLLRRDTIGYVWDSITSIGAAIAIAISMRR